MSTQMQKGTVVEKLVEETAKDDQHLRHLIHVCDGMKKVFNLMYVYISMWIRICTLIIEFSTRSSKTSR